MPRGKRGPQEAQRQTGVESEGRGAAQVAPSNHSELYPGIFPSASCSSCHCMYACSDSQLLMPCVACIGAGRSRRQLALVFYGWAADAPPELEVWPEVGHLWAPFLWLFPFMLL